MQMLPKSLTPLFNRLSKFGSTISGKVTVLAFSLVMVSTISISVFFFQETSRTLTSTEIENISYDAKIKSAKLREIIRTLGNDVLFLSRIQPIRENIHLDEKAIASAWNQHLAYILRSFIQSKPHYLHIEFIAAASGKELIRVERTDQGTSSIAGNDLREQNNTALFNKTLKLDAGEIYFSEVKLQRKQNKIVKPLRPIMQAATPIYLDNKILLGIAVISMDFSAILKDLLASHFDSAHRYITNHDGNILGDKEQSINFSFEQNIPQNILSIFPKIRDSYFNSSIQTTSMSTIKNNEELLLNINKVYIHPQDKSYFIAITEVVSIAEIQSRIDKPIERILLIILLLVGTATLLAMFLAHLITRPLNNIIIAVEEFGNNDGQVKIPKDADGEVGVLAQSFYTMVNQVKERREKLRQNETFIRSVIDNAPDGIMTINNLRLIRSFNPGAENIFGYSVDEVIGKDVRVLMSESLFQMHKEKFKNYTQISTNKIVYTAIEANGIHKSGAEIPLEISLSETSLNSQPIFIASIRDISRRRQFENQLKLSAKVMDTALEAIMITDKDVRIQIVNPAFEHITGYSLDDIKGKTPEIFKTEHHDQNFYARIWSTVRETGSWKGEQWVARKNGDIYPKWMSISAIYDDNGIITHYVGIFSDITERKLAEKRLEHLANYDPLTDLPNRRLFHDRLEQAIQRAERRNSQFGLLFLDLDHFKVINDTLGHNIGDELLVEVADRLHFAVRKSDTVARLAGDEFTVILDNIESADNATHVAQNIINTLSKPFDLGGKKHFSGVSIGISLYPSDGKDSETLLKHADIAMYHAKEKGRNNFQQYHTSMSTSIVHRLQLETQLRQALEDKDFVLHYQPQYDLTSNEIIGAEALIRWTQSDGTLIFPDKFIPTAEETKLILPIGDLVIEEACKQHVAWREQGLGSYRISVNVSANQLNHRNSFPQTVKDLLKKYSIEPKYIELEFTESVLIEQNPHTKATLDDLQEIGLPLSLDDFGTGYASLSQLKRLPFRVIKIDRSFVKDIPHDQDNTEIVRAIIAMSKSLNRVVIAEGVENEEQLNCLRELQCDQVQGYLFSRAIPGDEFSLLLKD